MDFITGQRLGAITRVTNLSAQWAEPVCVIEVLGQPGIDRMQEAFAIQPPTSRRISSSGGLIEDSAVLVSRIGHRQRAGSGRPEQNDLLRRRHSQDAVVFRIVIS